MSQIFPAELYDYILNDARKSAEVKVYKALKAQLGPEWYVFYNARLIGRRPTSLNANSDGEADFVIAHPTKGILILEAKGGRIDIEDGQWYSLDRHDRRHRIKNPVDQASDNKYLLRDTLKRVTDWPRQHMDFGHAAILPDARNPGVPLGPQVPPEIMIYADDMSTLASKITQIFDFFRRTGPGETGLQILKQIIAPTITVRKSLVNELNAIQESAIRLTESQFQLLDFIEQHSRALISGGAGTGKTFLAIEKARRLSDLGFKVLFTCFSPALAAFIRSKIPESDQLKIKSFHQLCRGWANAANLPSMPNEDTMSRSELITALPDRLLEASSVLPERFDAILVDEGQDFYGDWWAALELLLGDGADTFLYIFYDDNQHVQSGVQHLPKGLQKFSLNQNLRNARPIHDIAKKFFSGKSLRSGGPVEGKVEYVSATSGNLQKKLAEKILSLVNGGIREGDIAVLTGLPFDRSQLTSLESIGGRHVVHTPDLKSDHITIESISRFKGLEAPVVILAELDEICSPGQFSMDKLYVGMTRAVARLVVMGSDSVLKTCGRK
jgi:hypothetical protein